MIPNVRMPRTPNPHPSKTPGFPRRSTMFVSASALSRSASPLKNMLTPERRLIAGFKGQSSWPRPKAAGASALGPKNIFTCQLVRKARNLRSSNGATTLLRSHA